MKPVQKCLKTAFFLMATRGRLFWSPTDFGGAEVNVEMSLSCLSLCDVSKHDPEEFEIILNKA